MFPLLSLVLSASLASAATPEQVTCAVNHSRGVVTAVNLDDISTQYNLTSFNATPVQPYNYVEISISVVGNLADMVMYDYNLDGQVDFGSWYVQSASRTRMLIRPLLRYSSNWYLPSDIVPVGSDNQAFWQERFDEGIAKFPC